MSFLKPTILFIVFISSLTSLALEINVSGESGLLRISHDQLKPVSSLKLEIYKKTKIPLEDIILMHNGRLLDDSKSLLDSNLKDHDRLEFFQRKNLEREEELRRQFREQDSIFGDENPFCCLLRSIPDIFCLFFCCAYIDPDDY